MEKPEEAKDATSQIGIRVETTIKDRLEAASARRGLPLSGVVRWAILDWLRIHDETEPIGG